MHRCLAAFTCLVLAGCSPSTTAAIPSPSPSTTAAIPSPSPSPFADGSPTGAAVKMAGGCGATLVYKGGEPDWLTQAGDSNNPTDLPYFITDPPIAAGFIFGYPLHARVSPGQGNKILWVVGIPRNEEDLHITSHPLGASEPVLHMTFPPNSSPGEIYPSEVDVLSPGCWHFDLSWGKNTTSVDLVYS